MEYITITKSELQAIIKEAALEGARQAYALINPTEDRISQNKAYKRFGRAWMQQVIAEGLIKPIDVTGSAGNSTKFYSVSEIQSLKSTFEMKVEFVKRNTPKNIKS